MYGAWNLKALKAELKKRGAAVHGKKSDLVERLRAYDSNNDFEVGEESVQEPKLDVPPIEAFKDTNADSELPPITCHHISAYYDRFKKKDDSRTQMYKDGFLMYARICCLPTEAFIRGACRAEMRKSVVYNIGVRVDHSGWIVGAECECAAGSGLAHCKHGIVLLLAVEDMVRKGKMIINPACTQTLQSFHRPSKPFYGSPLKNPVQCSSQNVSKFVFDPVPMELRNHSFQDYFYNVVAPFRNSNMSMKCLFAPANLYAGYKHHTYSYSQYQYHQNMLQHLGLFSISEERVKSIEESTRKQCESSLWSQERNIPITASNFYSAVKAIGSDHRAFSEANRLINPLHFTSAATSYGKATEKIALQRYSAWLGDADIVRECGLIVMKSHPYLGCSPDRLIGDDTVLEIKCPYSHRNDNLTPGAVPYLELVKEEVQLKKSHVYYYQVQGQLMCNNQKFANFLVYSSKEMKVVDVRRDQDFIDSMLLALESLHNKYHKTATLEKFLYKNYDKAFPNHFL